MLVKERKDYLIQQNRYDVFIPGYTEQIRRLDWYSELLDWKEMPCPITDAEMYDYLTCKSDKIPNRPELHYHAGTWHYRDDFEKEAITLIDESCMTPAVRELYEFVENNFKDNKYIDITRMKDFFHNALRDVIDGYDCSRNKVNNIDLIKLLGDIDYLWCDESDNMGDAITIIIREYDEEEYDEEEFGLLQFKYAGSKWADDVQLVNTKEDLFNLIMSIEKNIRWFEFADRCFVYAMNNWEIDRTNTPNPLSDNDPRSCVHKMRRNLLKSPVFDKTNDKLFEFMDAMDELGREAWGK